MVILAGCPWGNVDRERIMLPMRDGVRLDTHIISPKGNGPWPVMVYRTPYNELDNPSLANWTAKGYVVVAQNARGRFKSEGDDQPFASDGWGAAALGGHTDGLDTLNWVLAQSWCNGRIGTWGGSARGVTQNLLAGADPAGIYGQWIVKAPASFYHGGGFLGGAYRQSQINGWLTSQGYSQAAFDLYEQHPTYDDVWAGLDVTARQHLRDYPVVNYAGWYDTFQQGTIDNFITIRENGGPVAREQSKLVINLSAHSFNTGAIAWPWTVQGDAPGYSADRFFEHYLKGVDNGFDDLPRVVYYMMGDLTRKNGPGNEWRYADDWPVPAYDVAFYCHNDGSLQLDEPAAGADPIAYDYDPANPVPTRGGANLMIASGNHDQRALESRSDVVLFDYGPLDEPLEVTGRLWVTLYGSSTAPDTDFTAKLTDVYPDGRSILITDGIIRARYRSSETDPTLMAPGTVYDFAIDLWSTALVFDTGHTIRLALSSSNAPRFAPNPNTGAALSLNDPVNPVVATNTVHLEADYPTRIVLPVTGPDDDTDGVPNLVDPD